MYALLRKAAPMTHTRAVKGSQGFAFCRKADGPQVSQGVVAAQRVFRRVAVEPQGAAEQAEIQPKKMCFHRDLG